MLALEKHTVGLHAWFRAALFCAQHPQAQNFRQASFEPHESLMKINICWTFGRRCVSSILIVYHRLLFPSTFWVWCIPARQDFIQNFKGKQNPEAAVAQGSRCPDQLNVTVQAVLGAFEAAPWARPRATGTSTADDGRVNGLTEEEAT